MGVVVHILKAASHLFTGAKSHLEGGESPACWLVGFETFGWNHILVVEGGESPGLVISCVPWCLCAGGNTGLHPPRRRWEPGSCVGAFPLACCSFSRNSAQRSWLVACTSMNVEDFFLSAWPHLWVCITRTSILARALCPPVGGSFCLMLMVLMVGVI